MKPPFNSKLFWLFIIVLLLIGAGFVWLQISAAR